MHVPIIYNVKKIFIFSLKISAKNVIKNLNIIIMIYASVLLNICNLAFKWHYAKISVVLKAYINQPYSEISGVVFRVEV